MGPTQTVTTAHPRPHRWGHFRPPTRGQIRLSQPALPEVTGYPVEFWLTIDQLARQAHHYLAELVATGKLARVSTFEELPPTVAGRIHDSLGLARLGPVEQVYVQLRVTDLLRFGCPPARKCPPASR